MPISSCRNKGRVSRRKGRHLPPPRHPPPSVLLCRPFAKMSREMFKNIASSPGMGTCGAGHFHCYCLRPRSGCQTLSGTWGPGPSGLASGLRTFLAFWKDTLFQAPWVPAAVWDHSYSGPQGTESGCGKWEMTLGSRLSSLWSRVCPTGPVLHLHSPPLSSSLRACWAISLPPTSDLGLTFPQRRSEGSRHHVSQALSYGPLVMCDSYCGSLSGTIQLKGLLTVSAFLYLRGLFSPDQTQTRKNDM